MITRQTTDNGPRAEIGSHAETNLLVPAASTVTIQISLSRSDWKCGIMYLYLPVTIGYAARRRYSAAIMFGRELDDAQSNAAQNQYISISAHYWNFPIHKGWRYDDDSALSVRQYGAAGYGLLRIKSCRIVDNEIQLAIQNTHGSADGYFTAKMEYEVMR